MQTSAVRPAAGRRARMGQVTEVAWPLLVGSLGSLALVATDTAVLGLTSTAELAAMATAAAVFTLAAALVIPLGTATQILVAQWVGADRRSEVHVVIRYGGVVVGACAAALTLLLVLTADPLTAALTGGVTPSGSAATLRLLAPAVLLTALTAHVRGAINGTGRTTITMRVALITNGVNIGLDLVFVLALGLGSRGVAAGTLLATACGLVVVLLSARRAGLLAAAGAPSSAATGDTAAIGPSRAVRQWWRIAWPDSGFALGSYGADLAILAVVAPLGAAALSGYRIIGTTTAVLFIVGFSVSSAISILVGQRLGAGDRGGARSFLSAGTLVAALGIGLVAAPVLFLPGWWLRLFTRDAGVVTATEDALRVYLIIAPAMVLALGLAGLVRGSGDTRSMMFVGLGAQVLCALPVAWLLVTRAELGLLGAALGLAAGWLLRTFLTAIFARRLTYRPTEGEQLHDDAHPLDRGHR